MTHNDEKKFFNDKKKKKKKNNYRYLGAVWFFNNKISLQISLKRNSTNSSYVVILSVNFENITIRLYVFIISFMLAKSSNINKIYLQTSLKKNSTNSSYISILSVNFKNLIVGLYILIISFIHACNISKRSKINYFVIKKMLNFPIFVI